MRRYLIAAVAAMALAGVGINQAWASTDHYLEANTMPYVTGFGTPPPPGDAFEPTRNMAPFAAVSEGGGYYEWQAPDAAGQNECLTANKTSGVVDSQPCGKYPASQEWNYNNDGGPHSLYNSYTNECIYGGNPYWQLGACGVGDQIWSTPDA